jgi:starvation-inducible DNA-binding protein
MTLRPLEKTKGDLNIGISQQNREGVVKILNTLLADEYILYTKTRNYHWNVTGSHFNDRHKFFQEQYEKLDELIDEIAERTRTIGGMSLATLTEFVKESRLKESPGEYPGDLKMISKLLGDHERIIRNLRSDLEICDKKYQDIGTNDFLTGLMEIHEKMAWMLRAHL